MDAWEARKKPTLRGADTNEIRILWLDHGRFADREFESLSSAVAYAESKAATASFHQGARVLASWDVVGGYKVYGHAAEAGRQAASLRAAWCRSESARLQPHVHELAASHKAVGTAIADRGPVGVAATVLVRANGHAPPRRHRHAHRLAHVGTDPMAAAGD
jgi:hypothetical protein